jgi:hypothetical protein
MTKQMSSIAPPDETQAAQRWVACLLSRGGIGKSLFAESFISWLRFADVAHAALDADPQNQTLLNRYKGQVKFFDASKDKSEFLRYMTALPPSPVIVTDFPAQATDDLLRLAEQYGLVEFFQKKGIRPTLIVFAADDPAVQVSASDTVQFFQDAADYVIVENPARFESEGVKRTKLFKYLAGERQSPTITMPAIAAPTVAAWELIERKAKAYLPIDKIYTEESLHDLSRHELRMFREKMHAQFEANARWLLPDVSLIKNRVPALAPLKVRPKSDRLTDSWLDLD